MRRAQPIGEAGIHFCHRCERPTRWAPIRGGRREACAECLDVFPCRSRSCGHLDCARARRAPTAPDGGHAA